MEHISFIPRGVCSRKIDVDIEDGIIMNVTYTGGCHGNTQGISALVVGMRVEDVIARLEGIRCGGKPTSCPDQLASALKLWQKNNAEADAADANATQSAAR